MQSEENNKESVTSTTEDHAPPGVRKDAAAEFLEFDDCVDVAAESVEVIVVTGEPVEEGFDVGVEAAPVAVLDWPAAAVEEAPSVMRLLAVGAESALAVIEDTSQFSGTAQEALRELTLEGTVLLRVIDRLSEELVRVVGHERDEADARGVDGGVREVAVVEDDHVALEERVAEVPAEERARGGGVRADDVVRDARRHVALLVLRREVARVDGEHLAADLERERVRLVAWEGRLRVAVRGERGRDGGHDVVDDVLRAPDEGVARVDEGGNLGRVETGTGLSGGSQFLTVKEHGIDRDFPPPIGSRSEYEGYTTDGAWTYKGYTSLGANVGGVRPPSEAA